VVSTPSEQIMEIVDDARAKYGLKPLGELRAAGALKDILTQQKEETVDALSVVARPVEVRPTVAEQLAGLGAWGSNEDRATSGEIAANPPSVRRPRLPSRVHRAADNATSASIFLLSSFASPTFWRRGW